MWELLGCIILEEAGWKTHFSCMERSQPPFNARWHEFNLRAVQQRVQSQGVLLSQSCQQNFLNSQKVWCHRKTYGVRIVAAVRHGRWCEECCPFHLWSRRFSFVCFLCSQILPSKRPELEKAAKHFTGEHWKQDISQGLEPSCCSKMSFFVWAWGKFSNVMSMPFLQPYVSQLKHGQYIQYNLLTRIRCLR
jgi:hypothetical protein